MSCLVMIWSHALVEHLTGYLTASGLLDARHDARIHLYDQMTMMLDHYQMMFARAQHLPLLAELSAPTQDRRWTYIRAGRAQDYHGPAVHPRHLSLWEKWVLGIHKQYNPELHREQRLLAQKNGWSEYEAARHMGEGI